jgi:hypothetical protein
MLLCVCVCISLPIVAKQRLGKNPAIVARQRLGRDVTAVTNTQATIEELLVGENWGHEVAQLIEVLRYKPEGRGFDSR